MNIKLVALVSKDIAKIRKELKCSWSIAIDKFKNKIPRDLEQPGIGAILADLTLFYKRLDSNNAKK